MGFKISYNERKMSPKTGCFFFLSRMAILKPTEDAKGHIWPLWASESSPDVTADFTIHSLWYFQRAQY